METEPVALLAMDSPVSNNGRGLKHSLVEQVANVGTDSPVSNNGRGLKRRVWVLALSMVLIRPLAITGVD